MCPWSETVGLSDLYGVSQYVYGGRSTSPRLIGPCADLILNLL